MSVFKNLFGKRNEMFGNDAMPTRGLNLLYPPVPENGRKLANQYVESVFNIEKKVLDYSLETLVFVDEFLQRFRDEGRTVNDLAETIFVAGAYVGEVMVIQNNGVWVKQEDVQLNGITMMPIVIKLPNGNIADPIAKAFKRLHFGESDSLQYFYFLFTK